MNSAHASNATNGRAAAPGMTVDDAIFTLFRHKWLILSFAVLGLVGAIVVRFVRPPLYVSKAKVMVHYVINSHEVTPSSADAPRQQSLDASAQSLMATEVEILTSLDVAQRAAELIGPAKLLAKKGGGTNVAAATAVVSAGLEVSPPRSSILAISFKHPDPTVVQPTLEAVLEAYTLKHKTVHLMPDDYLVKQQEDLRIKLSKTEEKLKDLKMQAKILFPDQMKKSYGDQITKVQDELLDAQREVLERQAMMGPGAANSATNLSAKTVPADDLSSYSFATTKLEELKREESELLLRYKDAHPVVQNVRERIQKLSRQKAELEQRYPGLSGLMIGSTVHGSTNTVPTEVLTARVAALSMILSNLQTQATTVMDLEPKMAELERLRVEQQKMYESVMNQLEQQQQSESLVSGRAINMTDVQRPTPPGLDYMKMLKLAGVALVGCIGLGLALAFLLDQFVDRSIKRSSDIERHLHLPVFLSIPDTAWGGWLRPPQWLTWFRRKAPATNGNGHHDFGATTTALAPWDPANQLLNYTEGLRERIISYFEVHNLNLKKPKLVAVTGCADGAGVSTLASGLAAALSKTGDGNVLLVDMNVDQGVARSFYKGKPGCGLSEALEPGNRSDAHVQDNLYLATLKQSSDNQLPKVLPRLNHLMPQLKASDYDYIIFDMPPVTQTSATPRLASYMDLSLLVLESEKTSRHSAARASALMREARANVAAVLNKQRSHTPASLSQEA